MPHLIAVPLPLDEANAFVAKHHRHHKPVQGYKFAIGAAKDGHIVGVIIAGRPVSRHLDNGWTLEVTRACSDGTRNVNSFLYGRVTKAAAAMGYTRIVTYTMQGESGASMRAVGWREIGLCGGGLWNREGRPRVDVHPLQRKIRWEAELMKEK